MKLTGAIVALATAALLVMLGLFSAGCGSNPASVTLSADADGSSVSLKPEQELVITLEGNPTTGYSWALVKVDKAVLAPVGEPAYQPSSTDSTLVGGGGTYELRFKAIAKGQTKLELGYGRSWETGVPSQKTFDLDVAVK